MLTTYGGLWSQLRLVLPLLALTGLGLGHGTAISSSGILRKRRVSPLELSTKESSESVKVHDDYKEDFISRLPDDILCSILSQLATKDAVVRLAYCLVDGEIFFFFYLDCPLIAYARLRCL